jgi:hypothetical protein
MARIVRRISPEETIGFIVPRNATDGGLRGAMLAFDPAWVEVNKYTKVVLQMPKFGW